MAYRVSLKTVLSLSPEFIWPKHMIHMHTVEDLDLNNKNRLTANRIYRAVISK